MFNNAFAIARYLTIIVMVGGLLMPTGCSKRPPPAPPANGMSLVCKEASYDFGRVAPNGAATLTHTFIVSNPTDHPVLISAVDCSCGCTAATAVPLEVQPRHNTRIVAVAHWADHVGPQMVSIVVRFRGGHSEPLILWIKGFVTSTTAAVPSRVNFGRLEPGQVRSRTVTICAGTNSTNPPRVSGVSGLPINASYVLRPGEAYGLTAAVGTNGAEDIVLTFSGLPKARTQSGWALVKLAGGGAIRLRYRALSPGVVVAAPSRLLLTGQRGTVAVARLKLLIWGGGHVNVRAPPRAKSGWFLLQATESGPPKKVGPRRVLRFRVTCAFDGGGGHCLFSSLHVEFNHHRIRVPLVVMEYP